MKLTLLGYGFVGKAVYNVLKDHHDITIVDPEYNDNKIEDQGNSDGYIICLPTPEGKNGECDMSIIFEMLNRIPIATISPSNILIKSTMSMEGWREIEQTYNHLNICFSPEFLTAANANEDFKKQTEMFFGGGDEYFWVDVFNPCKKFTAIFSSIPELILMKYIRNSFLATKVAFFNEIYDLCSKMNLQYDEVSYLVGMDKRIGYSHMKVPGPDGRGFGGACFPKDTKALYNSAKLKDHSLDILHAVITSNEKVIKDNV